MSEHDKARFQRMEEQLAEAIIRIHHHEARLQALEERTARNEQLLGQILNALGLNTADLDPNTLPDVPHAVLLVMRRAVN